MRKIGCFILLCLLILICVSCSIQGKKPKSGLWYCEELNTSIDFDLYQTTNYCVKVYQDDGSVQINGCHIDFGTGIHFCTNVNDEHNAYLYGNFKYDKKNNQFIIVSRPDGYKYIFEKQN